MQPPIASSFRVTKQYIVTMYGNRDSYQVPIALEETGALRAFVTDFYTPPLLRKLAGSRMPALHRRHHPALPAHYARWRVSSFVYDTLFQALGRRSDRHWQRVGDWLSKLSRNIAKNNPDTGIISYHNYSLYTFPCVSNSPKILFQYHPHPCFAEDLFAADYNRFSEVKWSFENERDSQPAAHHGEARLNEWKLADAIICASGVTKRSLEYAGCTRPIHVVPYGITPGFDEIAAGQKKMGGPCRFLFVGQGVQRKGLHHLLRAWEKARLGNAELRIVTSRMDPGIAARLPLNNVKLLGRLPQSELAQEFANADVFVMPSLLEGFGLVYLEALAAGCYCLGTRNTGLPELQLGREMIGYVEVGDIEGLVERLQDLERRYQAGDLDRSAISTAAQAFTFARFRERFRAAVAYTETASSASEE